MFFYLSTITGWDAEPHHRAEQSDACRLPGSVLETNAWVSFVFWRPMLDVSSFYGQVMFAIDSKVDKIGEGVSDINEVPAEQLFAREPRDCRNSTGGHSHAAERPGCCQQHCECEG